MATGANSLDAGPPAEPPPGVTENPPVVDPPITAPAEAAERMEAGSLFGIAEIDLTALIFVFGVIAVLVFMWVVRSGKGTPFLYRIYVVIILVFGTLLVVSSAYSTEQIAPVVGFFGTIAGYLLGRGDRASDTEQSKRE